MSYPFTTEPYGPRWPGMAPEPGLWLSSLTGKEYARFIEGQVTAEVDFATDSDQVETGEVSRIGAQKPLQESNSVGSLHVASGMHKPVLDIDMPALLVPSSTPGHSHLYIDAPMDWPDYAMLLKALAGVGIIQSGYLGASLAREGTWVRTPWTRKQYRGD